MRSAQPETQAAFRTVVAPEPSPRRITLERATLSLGSCFAEHMAQKLADYRFPVCSSPTGTLYNPFSVASALRRILGANPYTAEELFEHEGMWKSFDHHSRFDAPSVEEALQRINTALEQASGMVEKLGSIVLTFGTSWVYRLAGEDRVVANCHRLPSDRFERRLASVEEIISEYEALLDIVYRSYPELNIIMTVSPVRHLRDDPHENGVSKAHLLAAIYRLERRFSQIYYFPSYEIMMDELRDYRFYEANMTHPSGVAIDYIWMRFAEACLDEQAQGFLTAYEPIRRARGHRVQGAGSAAAKRFARRQLEKIERVARQFPMVDLAEDRAFFAGLCEEG